MTPRPRRRGSKDLPENLYQNKKNGRIYYRYKHPVTGRFTGFGTDKAEAIKAARQLNQLLARNRSDLQARVISTDNPFSDFLDTYSDTILPARTVNGYPLSERTISENRRIIKRINKELGHIDITELVQRDIADYLNSLSTPEVHNKHRAVLMTIFKYAISDGLVKENLPSMIIPRDLGRTKRRRLTLDEYDLIYQHARPAIQNAMELSLNAMQRRTDIRGWRFDMEHKDGYVYLIQSKTRKHGKSAYLRIPVDLPVVHSASGSRTLADILRKCRDRYACPYVIHEQPQRRRSSSEKTHSMQLSAKQISDGFAEAREAAGITAKEGATDTPPTFHELLALGAHLREKQGWTKEQIKTLRGHTTEKMTRHYLEGHEWTTVEVISGENRR